MSWGNDFVVEILLGALSVAAQFYMVGRDIQRTRAWPDPPGMQSSCKSGHAIRDQTATGSHIWLTSSTKFFRPFRLDR